MKNLKIRAYLQTQIVSDRFLPLDSILHAILCRQKHKTQILTESKAQSVEELLPIKIAEQGESYWYYHASFAIWSDDMREGETYKTKRSDFQNNLLFVKDNKKIETAKGQFKDYMIAINYRFASYVEWHIVATDTEKIIKLLQFCTALGKEISNGFGQVLKWEITEMESDFSIHKNDKLTRAVPVTRLDDLSNLHGFRYGIRPSYWLPKHQFVCKMP